MSVFLILFFVFLTGLFMTYTLYLFTSRASDKKRALLKERLADAIRTSAHSTDMDVQLAREELMSEIPWLNRVLIKLQISSKLKRMIDQADSHITVMRLVLFSLTGGALAALAVSMLSTSYLLMGFFGVMAAAFPFLHIHTKRKKRLKKFLQLLPDALDLMSRGLSAGHAFTEALQMVATEMPEPISTEFRKTYEEQNLGLSLKLALENLVERVPLLDLRMCVTAVLIQRETGGNLSELLEKVAYTIRERFRIMEDLKTMTLSSRWSAWLLCGLPIFLAVYVTLMNPGYMDVMWRDARGNRLLAVAAIMQVLGMLMVQKIMKIRI
jgi:tight adherence protein B